MGTYQVGSSPRIPAFYLWMRPAKRRSSGSDFQDRQPLASAEPPTDALQLSRPDGKAPKPSPTESSPSLRYPSTGSCAPGTGDLPLSRAEQVPSHRTTFRFPSPYLGNTSTSAGTASEEIPSREGSGRRPLPPWSLQQPASRRTGKTSKPPSIASEEILEPLPPTEKRSQAHIRTGQLSVPVGVRGTHRRNPRSQSRDLKNPPGSTASPAPPSFRAMHP